MRWPLILLSKDARAGLPAPFSCALSPEPIGDFSPGWFSILLMTSGAQEKGVRVLV